MRDREWGINDWNKPNFVDAFECTVCRRIHENIRREQQGEQTRTYQANWNHYGCPKPLKFSDNPPGNLTRVEEAYWGEGWERSACVAKALKKLIESGQLFTQFDLFSLANELRSN